MEVILKKDMHPLGFRDDIVNVKPGFGRNFLIPKGIAQLATSSAKKVHAENLKQKAVKDAKLKDEASKLGIKLEALAVKVVAKVGHDTEKYTAEDAVYAKLHSCCKYERKADHGHDHDHDHDHDHGNKH